MNLIAPEQIVDLGKIDEYFPMQQYREHQREVIHHIGTSINAGFKYIIAECPTGSGKSPIAVTLCRMAEKAGAFYITTTKMLQDQIEADFPTVVTLKGRNAYPCTAYDNFQRQVITHIGQTKWREERNDDPRCDMGFCKKHHMRSSCRMCVPSIADIESGNFFRPEGMQYSACPYYEQLNRAKAAQTCSLNFNNFILHMNFSKSFAHRRILVIDEAHNTESKMLDFLTCNVTSHHLDCAIPVYDTPIEYVLWLDDIGAIDIFKDKVDDYMARGDAKMASYYENLCKNYITMMLSVKEDPKGWISEHVVEKNKSTRATMKPIFVKKAAHRFLFNHADVVIFLSATILNAKTFAANLGIEPDEYKATRIPSTFPVKNRPIVKDFAGKFTGGKSARAEWMPKMAAKVEEICDRYSTMRGIIHTHSFGIQKELIELLPGKVVDRLLTQHNYREKTDMIDEHTRKEGSILIAPAMHEGVDLKDDMSRFQIVCKMPYANFYEDKQLAARMEMDFKYYDYLTILKMVQSVGRSVRSPTDWAHTFIIDEAFNRLYTGNQSSFPQWFKEAITTEIPVPF